MRFKRLVLIFLFVIVFLYIYLKSPNDNKDLSKLNEISERINEIERLIQTNRKNFELIKNAVFETQLNPRKMKEIKDLKVMLNLLQSQSNIDGSKNFKWTKYLYKICPAINFTKSDINMMQMYENFDFTDVDGGVWKQGFNIEYKALDFQTDKLKVFVVPHSHQDPGWIKTFEEYFNEESKSILDNMLLFLNKEPNMTFIYSEISYFEKWWKTINDLEKNQVKRLLQNNQLELVTGGWVMTDEANSHYFSILTQLTEGHTWLKTNLNYIPQSGWSIDPFGYSQFMPYILKKSGINNMVIQRTHYIVKKNLAKNKQLEFRWKQIWDSDNNYAIPCHLMPFFSYDIPHTCGPDPSVCCQFDFIRMLKFQCPWGKSPVEITDSNVNERAEMLLDQYRKKSRLFDNGNVVLIPLGDDFRYKDENEWLLQYKNYKKLMNYMNSRKDWNIEIRFGILSDYFNAIKKHKSNKLPLLIGDMFAYADREEHYWTGYFTSRPILKILDRILMTNLRSAEMVLSLSLVYRKKYEHVSSNVFNRSLLMDKIKISRQLLSLNQHHDAITGTSKSKVASDFEKKLLKSIDLTKDIFIRSSQSILQNNIGRNQVDEIIFDIDDISKSYGKNNERLFIDLISNVERYIYLFNSLPQPRQVLVNIHVQANAEKDLKIVGSGNQFIKCQIIPFLHGLENVNPTRHIVSFKLNIGPLAFEKVKIVMTNDVNSENHCLSAKIHLYNVMDSINISKNYKVIKENTVLNDFIIIDNSLNKFYINSSTGYFELIEDFYSKTQHKLKVMLKKYGVKNVRETSGAYIFIPDGDGEIVISNELNSIIHLEGFLHEDIIVHTKYVLHIFRFHKVDGLLANAIDIENIIDISKETNFEISMIVETDFIIPSDEFYVDVNCFQFIKRKTFKKLPIQANVYPMSCGAYLESQTSSRINKMSLFSKQSNGVRGGRNIILEGETYAFLEVFQDRILNQDDNRGIFEALKDNKIISKNYRLIIEGWKQNEPINNELGELTNTGYQLLNDLNYPIHNLYVKSDFTNKIPMSFVGQKSLLTGYGMPCDYQIVNLRTDLNELPKLTIHRVKVNCNANYVSEGSCKFSLKKSPLLKSMFDDVTINHVNKLRLTGSGTIQNKISPEDIRVNVMELETFEVYFDN